MGGRGSGNPGGKPENLTHRGVPGWPKGGGGNPSGRATRLKTMVTDAIREKLAQMDPKRKKIWAKVMADLLFECASDPDPELDKTRLLAISEIIDRSEGKPKQQLDLNDITAEIRQRPDEDLQFHLQHGYWPEEEYEHKRNQKMMEKLQATKSDTETTQ